MPDEKHFPTRSLGYVPDEKTFATPNLGRRLSGQIAKIADEDCLVAPHLGLGASPYKGPGENKFFTKRISWSDWKICFRPAPLAETKAALLGAAQTVPGGKVFLSRSTIFAW